MDKNIEKVLLYQDKQLKELEKDRKNNLQDTISSTEKLLDELGISYSNTQTCNIANTNKQVLLVPKWDDLVLEASKEIDDNSSIYSLFTEDELKQNSLAIKQINRDFRQIYKLDKGDWALCILAGLIGGLTDIFLVGIPHNDPKMAKDGSISDLVKKTFNKIYPPERINELENMAKVPFDSQDNRNLEIPVEGLSAYMHRLYELGHDPIVGYIVGVIDIMKGTTTTIDKFGKFVSQDSIGFEKRIETNLVKAIIKEFNHLQSDVNTPMGLPAPLMGLCNLLQIGKIGEDEQTVAEIMQGMYYEGFDFRHFVSQSVSTIIIETIVRFVYSIRKIKAGNEIKDSIPISLNRDKNPKLATMLFISHSLATAVNAGKVYLTKDPCAINEAEWLAFAKYSFKQAKWVLIDKPARLNKQFDEWAYNELIEVIRYDDELFDEFSKDYIVVFD